MIGSRVRERAAIRSAAMVGSPVSRRFAMALVVTGVVIGCGLRHEPPPPPPPPPPASAATTTTTTTTTTAPATSVVPTTSVPPTTGAPPTTAMAPLPSGMPPTTGLPPTTGVPPTTVIPHLSPTCERAVRCCSLIARYTSVRGARARCAQLARARDSQCSEAIGEIANAILQEGQRPPEICTQPRHR